ncbi:MAG: hypothetical protein ABFD25_05105 [Clostridiaceae bacterium]
MVNRLYHYYELKIGPFVNLSDLPIEEAKKVQADIKRQGAVFASKRDEDYLVVRRRLEERVRNLFIIKGGKPLRERPQYMTLGPCPWMLDWYVDGRELSIPLSEFSREVISFTYGDTFPAMRVNDGKPYRGIVYTLDEIDDVVKQYGFPQEWNHDGSKGPDRYIEAQIWTDNINVSKENVNGGCPY